MKYRLSFNTIGFEHKDGYIEVAHWNGDDIVEAPPSILINKSIILLMQNENLTGIKSIHKVELKGNILADQENMLYKVSFFTNEGNDLFINKDSLCVSEKGLYKLKNLGINILSYTDYSTPLVSP